MLRSILVFIITIIVLYFLYGFFFSGDESGSEADSTTGISSILNRGNNEENTRSTEDILAEIDDFRFLDTGVSSKSTSGGTSTGNSHISSEDPQSDKSGGPANVTIDPDGGIKKGTAGIVGFVPARVAAGSGFNDDCTGGIIFDPCLIVGDPIPADGQMYFGTDRS